MNALIPPKVKRRSGSDFFHSNGGKLPFSIEEFWQWSSSDLINNALRGTLAEFLVAKSLGCADGVRVEWDAYDLKTVSGTRIEVKTSGYIQSWIQQSDSTPNWDIAPKLSWDASSNTSVKSPQRSAEVYVFALHAHRDRETIDATDLSQWEFYVLSTKVLDVEKPDQKKITLPALKNLGAVQVDFLGISKAITEVLK